MSKTIYITVPRNNARHPDPILALRAIRTMARSHGAIPGRRYPVGGRRPAWVQPLELADLDMAAIVRLALPRKYGNAVARQAL
ncbi:hypothetical protein [Rugamonas aquatica]|uniref:Uncharacterized protein n=1 Tax=Rugamonas aquatica TaxID=2743357 RepID=A0A6A7N6U9_9BURK|nr:hypothetical protein [Rugamonas aquatica]MQA40651.1 hypothetical protein [Rugamonas aquatica]